MKTKIDNNQYQRLKKWERKMIITFIGWCVVFILVYASEFLFNADMITVNILVTILMVWGGFGVFIQFSEKCPNCNYRIGFSSSLLLPKSCKKCGIVYQNSDA